MSCAPKITEKAHLRTAECGIDQVPSSRGPVPTIWLHAASTCWALPQRRNRAWPRLYTPTGSLPLSANGPRATAGACSCVARRGGTMRRRGKLVRRPLRRRGQRPPRRPVTSQEPATISRTRSDEGRTRRARGADHNALKEHPFSNQRFFTSFVWPRKATTQQAQKPRNENLKMTNQTR